MTDRGALIRLYADGFVRWQHNHWVPTDRWHAAIARAAVSLLLRGEDVDDLRVPVAWALSEYYDGSTTDEEIVEMVAVMTPLSEPAHPPSGEDDVHRDPHR